MDNANGLDQQGSRNFGDYLAERGEARPTTLARQASSVARQPSLSAPKAAPAGNPFHRFHGLGYHALVPLIPVGATISPSSSLISRVGRIGAKDPRGKAPGIRTPKGWVGHHAWTRGLDATLVDCDQWQAMGADVGLRMGDGLYGLDFDTLSDELAAQCWWITRKIIPGPHAKRIGRAPKFAIVVRLTTQEKLPYKLVEFTGKDGATERVEGLSAGKQLKIWGLHPVTGLPYSCEPELPPRDELVEATPKQIFELFDELQRTLPAASAVRTEGVGAEKPVASLRGDPKMIEAAMRRLPNTTAHFPTREDYRDIGYAVKASIADERHAFEVFSEWSDRWNDDPEGYGNVDGYAEAIWRTLDPRKIGAGWLLKKFEAVTGEPVATHWFEPIAEPEPSIWDAAPIAERAHARPAFELVDFVDAAARSLEDGGAQLVDGLIECGSFAMLYGPSGAGKTFTALDIAFHIAFGIPWNGMAVRRMRVVYLALEGAAGARKRSDALRRRFGISEVEARGWFFYRMANVDLFHPQADLMAAIDAISAVPDVGLVVVDTTSRALSGADENSSVDMGIYVANIDRIRAATAACVMSVHHTGKDIARGARGHSLLRAATDTEIEVADGEFKVTKQREIETEFSCAFALDVVQLGTSPSGKAVTSCVVRWDHEQRGARRVTEKESLVLAALEKAYAKVGEPGAKPDDVVEALMSLSVKMSGETVRAHFKNLAKKFLVVSGTRGRWAPKTGNSELALPGSQINSEASPANRLGRQPEKDVFQ